MPTAPIDGTAPGSADPAVAPPPSDSTLPSPVLVAEHLAKTYGRRQAVADVSFAIDRGQVFGFL